VFTAAEYRNCVSARGVFAVGSGGEEGESRKKGRRRKGGERERENNGDERALSRAKRVMAAAGNSVSREAASQLRARDDSAKNVGVLSLSLSLSPSCFRKSIRGEIEQKTGRSINARRSAKATILQKMEKARLVSESHIVTESCEEGNIFTPSLRFPMMMHNPRSGSPA